MNPTGLFCYAPQSLCTDFAHARMRYPPPLRTSTCEALGYNLIATRKECEAAARALQLPDTSVNMASTSNLAQGCTAYKHPNNPYGDLVFNENTNSLRDCGYDNRHCLCAAFGPAPPCDVQDGTAPHTSTNGTGCFCGDTAICTGTNTTGLFCNAGLSRCAPHAIPTCPIANGTEANPHNCACGTADCTRGGENPTGLFCYRPRRLCASSRTSFKVLFQDIQHKDSETMSHTTPHIRQRNGHPQIIAHMSNHGRPNRS